MWSLIERPEDLRIRTVLRISLLRNGRGPRLGLATTGLMLHQACEAAVPVLIGVVIDRAVAPGDRGALLLWLGVLAVVFLVFSLSYQRASLGMVGVYGYGEHDLRQLTIARILHPRRQAALQREGEVLSVATSDTYRVAGVAWSIAQQSATLAAVGFATVVLLRISVPLGLGVLAGAVLVLWTMQALARPLEKVGMAEQASVAAASEVATDTLAGLRIVHGLGAQAEMIRRYRLASQASRVGAIAAARMLLAYQAVSTAVSVIYLAVLALAASWLAVAGQITPGQLVTVVGLAQFLQGSLDHVGTFGANWAHKRASARRLHGFVAEPFVLPAGSPEAVLGESSLRWQGIDLGAKQLTGVKVSSAIEARRVAEVLGFRVAAHGLTLRGQDVREIGPERYAENVVAPPHDAMVFSGTLRSNIVTGRELDADLLAASALDDVIDQWGTPDAPVGEGGRRLSGGQRQRVLLARALHAPGRVVVLDEPTTALDPVTEQRVANRLRELKRPIVVVTSSRILLDACDLVVQP
ncbi:ABC transporter transmembrane domain-containing protein [Kineosporia babensis]|uniref:ABC transporter ATP-binding protein/permease n=1 Tax=Kineosporia babensis TaxID=499548 RepID=A0A9X1STH9_9ACTN|nr:ABC transporter ATP-binding protein [Kineosporia babensis]MCD5311847.1 ABC transporter ATP-binding protein/permease [Kineosporia babensis]